MSRYRNLKVCTWTDEKVRDLSPIPACGQGLWIYLLTGPMTGPIPGLFRAGRAALIEELGWESDDFDRTFQELVDRGMARADFKARLIWLPNGFRHNPPANPNVVKSWRSELAIIPECQLKQDAIVALLKVLAQQGANYVDALRQTPKLASAQAIVNGFGNGSVNSSANGIEEASGNRMPNQEQYQYQKQDKDLELVQVQDGDGLTPDMVAGAVMDDLRLSGTELRFQLEAQCRMEMRAGASAEIVRTAMVSAWRDYEVAKPRLQFTVGAAKFFGEMWRNQATWPWKEGERKIPASVIPAEPAHDFRSTVITMSKTSKDLGKERLQ
jgi:hypothetical protein